MKTLTFALFFFLGLSSLEAQQQAGSVEIAKSATPTDLITSGAVDCFSTVSAKMAPEKAADFCLKVARIETDRGKRIANEAADATKASRPMVIATGRYGSGWSGSYGYRGGGWSGGRRIIIASDRAERNAKLQQAREERNAKLRQERAERTANLRQARLVRSTRH